VVKLPHSGHSQEGWSQDRKRAHPATVYSVCLGYVNIARQLNRASRNWFSALEWFLPIYDASAMASLGSQVPIDAWYDIIPAPTIADAILDRLVHNACRLQMKEDSMRKKLSPGCILNSWAQKYLCANICLL